MRSFAYPEDDKAYSFFMVWMTRDNSESFSWMILKLRSLAPLRMAKQDGTY
jgi:hypothetical protein